jgi:hypothetical protein
MFYLVKIEWRILMKDISQQIIRQVERAERGISQ